MRILPKLLTAFFLISLIFGAVTLLIFMNTFKHTNNASLEMREKIFPRIILLDLMKDKRSTLHLDVVDYISGDNISSKDLISRINELENLSTHYFLSHDDWELDNEEFNLEEAVDNLVIATFDIIEMKENNATYDELNLFERTTFHDNLRVLEEAIDKHDEEYTEDITLANNHLVEDYNRGRMIILLSSLISIVVSALIGLLISKSIAKPLINLNTAANAMRTGELIKVQINTKDEFGELAESFNLMTEDLKKKNIQLENKVDEMQKFTKLVVGRELKMIELKRKIEEMNEAAGEKK